MLIELDGEDGVDGMGVANVKCAVPSGGLSAVGDAATFSWLQVRFSCKSEVVMSCGSCCRISPDNAFSNRLRFGYCDIIVILTE